MGFFKDLVGKVHEITKVIAPIEHELMNNAHESSTKLVNETSGLISDIGGNSFIGDLGRTGEHLSDKDKADFNGWLVRSGIGAATYGAGSAAAGAAGGGGAAAGAGGAGGAGAGAAGAAGGGAVAGGGWGSAAATAGSALLQAWQSQKAADAMRESGDAANATQRYIFDMLNGQQAPYRALGYNALDNISGLMRDPSSIVNDPGYEFQRQQGQQGIERSAAARGLGLSGAALKASSRYNTDYATTKLNDTYNRNASVAGLGQVANAQTAQAGMNYGNNVSANQLGMGNATAANYLNQGNIWGNALSDIGASYFRK